MKKFYFPLTVLFLVLVSCNIEDVDIDEENLSGNTSGDIIGVWTGTSIDYSGESETTTQGQTLVTEFVGEGYDMNYTITFSENPNTIVSDGSYSLELTSTVLGQSSVQNVEDITFLEEGSWDKNGSTLTISTNNGGSYDYVIEELTNDTLIISISTLEDLSQAGVTITSTIDAEMTFTR